MSKSKISGKLLSIQLSRSEMQIVLVDKGSEILHSVCVPVPSGAVEDGVIRNVEAVTETLKAAVKTPELKRVHQAVFTLCTTQVITETVTTPELTGKKLEKLLRANMDMYFPVDVQDYHLVWQVIGPKFSEGGLKEQAVQLWALPKSMISRYYTVANSCGLSVMAIDYCGNSVATAIGASYSKNTKAAKQRRRLDLNQEITFGKGKGKFEAEQAPETVVTGRRNPDTDLHILLEKDLLGMTFVQNDQIVLQRFVRRSAYASYQFGELSMMLEYFRAMDIGRGSEIRGIVSGAEARDAQIVEELAETLDIPVTELISRYEPQLCLCMGAARTTMEFGIPTLNKVTSGRQQMQGQLWQYALILAGGLAVVMVGMHLLQSRLGWDADISRLNNSYQTLAIQHQQTAGYADNYHAYKSAYDRYSEDWDQVFASLRLSNDNLVLLLQELEEIVPENASITNMSIKPEYLQVSFACKTKEEAAYLIMSLRDMKYASLQNVSDLKGGGKGAAKTYGNGYADEAPPVEGGSTTWNPEWMDKEDFVQAVVAMSSEDRNTLKNTYGKTPSSGYTYEDLLNHESGGFDDAREPAMREMLNYDPFAMDIFKDLLKEEYKIVENSEITSTENTILIKCIEDDLTDYAFELDIQGKDPFKIPENLDEAREILDVILNAVFISEKGPYTREERITALEDLFRTSSYLDVERHQYMESAYCHYLEAELVPSARENFPFLDVDRIAQEGFQTGVSSIDGPLNQLLEAAENPPEETEPTEDPTEPTEKPGESEDNDSGSILEKYFRENEEKVGSLIQAYLTMGTTMNNTVDNIIEKYLINGTTENEGLDECLDEYLNKGNLDSTFASLLQDMRNGNSKPSGSDIVNRILSNYIKTGRVENNKVLERCLRLCDPGEKTTSKTESSKDSAKETAATASQPSSPYADGRIHFTVILGYNEDLLNAELSRKGLNFADKIPELEVAE